MSNEWVMVPREPTANQLVDGAYEVPDPISHRGELTARMVYRAMLDAAPAAPAGHDFIAHEYRKGFIDGQISMREQLSPAAPQQAEPVTTITVHLETGGHAVTFDALYVDLPVGEHPLYLHPPAAEVQRLREALKPFAAIDLTTNQAVDAMDVLRARRALEGK